MTEESGQRGNSERCEAEMESISSVFFWVSKLTVNNFCLLGALLSPRRVISIALIITSVSITIITVITVI
jgi:hypothetical protein